MKTLTGYMAGVNLGGWISQYREYNHDHFKSFIVEEDIALIASWGMDHIRVPVDYPVLESDENPGVYLENGFDYLDASIAWAKKYGLNVIIDVHKAPGFSFNTVEKNTLFTDDKQQERFVSLWRAIAKRYASEGDNVMYELLNEIVEPDSSRWNALAQRLIDGIRKEDTKHCIVVGGIHYNSVKTLDALTIFDDPKIVYNFHMYVPMILTHQHASWTKEICEFNRSVLYPSDLTPYRDFAKLHPEMPGNDGFDAYEKMDKAYVRDFMQPAVDFIKKHDVPMYCGEYGVIDNADMDARINWTNDVSDFLLEHGIGRAIWSYKRMSFTLIDENRKPVSDRLIQAASKH